MKAIFAIMCTLVFFGWAGTRVVASINFDRNCEGYLKRAADANTVDLAVENLEVAIKYAKENGLTGGFTSIVYRTPNEDLGFWYKNLAASLNELRTIEPDASQLQRTNVLMKLRETLLDQGQGTSVTVPAGISVYPNNTAFAVWGIMSALLSCALWFLAANESPY